jgi:O-succinylbenzoic acid--CoA ligase
VRLRWNDEEVGSPDWSALANEVRAQGIRPGHRVALLAGNTPLAVAAHLAARAGGWTVVPFAASTPAGRLRAAAQACEVAAWISVSESRDVVVAAAGEAPIVVHDARGAPVEVRGRPTTAPPGPLGVRCVVHTSGTSATPKPVALTEGMLAAHAAAAGRRLPAGPSVWLGVMPLHHVGGVALLDRFIRADGTLHLEERFDARRVASALREGNITHVSLVPTMLHRLVEEWGPHPPPASLRCVLLGGAAAPENLVRLAIGAGWPVWCTYGLTEASSQVATARPEEHMARPGTSGRALDGVVVRIVDGEIEVSGPTVAGGGPFRTGDVGRMDAQGFLFVHGRLDERITTGGEKVDPGVVESVLASHPSVREVCVVGVPDAQWGQRVVAVLAGPDTPPAELRRFCKERLAAHEVPKAFLCLPTLPRSETGKVRRAEVAAIAAQATVPT